MYRQPMIDYGSLENPNGNSCRHRDEYQANDQSETPRHLLCHLPHPDRTVERYLATMRGPGQVAAAARLPGVGEDGSIQVSSTGRWRPSRVGSRRPPPIIPHRSLGGSQPGTSRSAVAAARFSIAAERPRKGLAAAAIRW